MYRSHVTLSLSQSANADVYLITLDETFRLSLEIHIYRHASNVMNK